MSENEPILIKQLFSKSDSCLNKTLKTASELKQLNQSFQKILDSELVKHCYIAELTKGAMTIIVDNASWATILRYAIPDITKSLRAHPQFKTLHDIHYKVAKY